MLLMCSGYYNYRQGHVPKFDGFERFRGRVVHPQQWPEDLDYRGKRIAVTAPARPRTRRPRPQSEESTQRIRID